MAALGHWAVRAATGLVIGTVALAAGLGGVGMLAGAGYLALRASHSPSVSAAVVGGILLGLFGVMVLGAGWLSRRANGAAAGPTPKAPGLPPELRWIAREPLAASAAALLFGVGAGRSPELRRLLRTMLKEWMALRH